MSGGVCCCRKIRCSQCVGFYIKDRTWVWTCTRDGVRFFGLLCSILAVYIFTIIFCFQFADFKEIEMQDHYNPDLLVSDDKYNGISKMDRNYTVNYTNIYQFVDKHYYTLDDDTDDDYTATDNTSNDDLLMLSGHQIKLYRCCLTAATAIPSIQRKPTRFHFFHRIEWSHCHGLLSDKYSRVVDQCMDDTEVSMLLPLDWTRKGEHHMREQFTKFISWKSSITPKVNGSYWRKNYHEYAIFITVIASFWLIGRVIIMAMAYGCPGTDTFDITVWLNGFIREELSRQRYAEAANDPQVWANELDLVSTIFILLLLSKLFLYFPATHKNHGYCFDGSRQSLSDPDHTLDRHDCDDWYWKSAVPHWFHRFNHLGTWVFVCLIGLFLIFMCYHLGRLCKCHTCCDSCCDDAPIWDWFEEKRYQCSSCLSRCCRHPCRCCRDNRRNDANGNPVYKVSLSGVASNSNAAGYTSFNDQSPGQILDLNKQLKKRDKCDKFTLWNVWMTVHFLCDIYLLFVVIANIIFILLTWDERVTGDGATNNTLFWVVIGLNNALIILLVFQEFSARCWSKRMNNISFSGN